MTTLNGSVAALDAEYRNDPGYVAEGLALLFAENVARLLHDRGQSRKAFAEQLGVSPAMVTRTLNAPPNLTLRTIAAFALALDVPPLALFATPCELPVPS
ncbi:MAG: helix-turn-helix domain-containing protein [Dehalococcoidia bacterium]